MKQENKTIRIRDLLFSVLYGWKKILWTVVILALLLGGYMGVQGVMQLDPEVRAEEQQKYQDALIQYANTCDTLELNIRNLQIKLEEAQEYMAKSVLMNMNYQKVYDATAMVYVDTGYQIDPQLSMQNPDYTKSVILQYMTSLTGGAVYQEIAEEWGIEAKYLHELVTVARLGENTITIQVFHDNEEDAVKLVKRLVAYTHSCTATVAKTVGTHTIRCTEPVVAVTINTDVEAKQHSGRDTLTSLSDQLLQHWNMWDNLAEPQSGEMTVGKIVRNTIKGVIIGGVLGGVLAVMVLALAFLLSDKVYSGDALAARTQIRVLGSLESGKKRNVLDRWLWTLEGRAMENNQKNRNLIGAWAANCIPENVVLCGDVKDEHMEWVSDILKSHGIQVLIAGNVLCDGAVVAQLPNCTGVVLVVRCGKTTYTDISRMAELAQDAQKSVLAAIAID